MTNSISGYNAETKIARFYNRDAENEVGLELKLTCDEYWALDRFLNKLHYDGIKSGRLEVVDKVQCALQEKP